MPDVRTIVERVRGRWRIRSVAWTIAVAGAGFALFLVTLLVFRIDAFTAHASALMAAVLAAIVSTIRQRSLTPVEAAQLIEIRHPALDNLIVTATELDASPRPVRADIRDEIIRQAADRVGAIDASRVVPLAQPLLVASAALVSAILLLPITSRSPIAPLQPSPVAETEQGLHFKVRITPPGYTKRGVQTLSDPVELTAIAGSRIRIDTAAGQSLREWVATNSEGIELPGPFAGKFLSVIVVPDRAPDVRLVAPGKDTAFAQPSGRVNVEIQTTDDLGLAALALRFTKAAGGGENVAFTEGEVPVAIDRRGDQHWNGRATIDLSTLGLEDGDIVVYRAVARDTNPQGTPVQSEQYLIEIGKNAGIADAGFALPTEEKKYAISQQMVIYRTEKIIAERQQHQGEWLEQNQAIAVEQRMVRAEVVFLGGGEVEDELEEAAKSDELTEGRLQNTGRVEMLRAINAMSRAEALLNEGRAEDALVFERQALASLERALDRRRFFLRTLPDRSRIDATRRLTGDRRDAAPWDRQPSTAAPPASLEGQRQLMRELAAAPTVDARLAARILAIDPSSTELQKAAVRVASAGTDEDRQAAIRRAMTAIANHALQTLPSSSTIDLASEPLAGRLATQLTARPRQ